MTQSSLPPVPPPKKSTQWYLLKDSSGKKSVSYTMMVYTFMVCTLWLTLSIFNKIHHLEIRSFDAGEASIWFAPIAALYFGRKWQGKDELVKTAIAAKSKPASGGGDSSEAG